MATMLRGGDGESRLDEAVLDGGPDRSLAGIPLFADLSDDEFEELMSSSSSHQVERHELVYCEGQKLEHMYLSQKGSFKLVRHSEEGKELIVALARAGECFGALAEPIESQTLAQALEPSTYIAVPLPAIIRATTRNPDFAIRLVSQSERRHRNAEKSAERLAFETVPARLAHLIMDESTPGTGELVLPLNQTEIANLIGSSRETVCSILNQFRRDGMLQIHRGRIRVLDRDRLGSVR